MRNVGLIHHLGMLQNWIIGYPCSYVVLKHGMPMGEGLVQGL